MRITEVAGYVVKVPGEAYLGGHADDAVAERRGDYVRHRLGRLGLGFLEAPVAPEDLPGQAEVARALEVPVAVGEELRTRYDFRELLTRRAAGVLQPDVGRMGVGEAATVGALAEAFHRPVAPHLGVGLGVYIAASVQVAAALGNLLVVEYQPSQFRIATRFLTEGLDCSGGSYGVPEGPGLGITVDETAVAAHATSSFTLDAADLDR